jgi:cell division transport system permease protein
MRVLKYSFEEAWASMRRSLGSVAASILTIAAAFLVLGAFLLVWTNLRQLVAAWSTAAELSVYFADDAKDADRIAVERVVGDRSIVASSEFVSKTAALARFKQEFPDLAALAAGASGNPFPASFEVRVRSGPEMSDHMSSLAARLSKMPGVTDVRYDRRWLERLQGAVNAVEWVGAVFGGVLVLGALLTVANVIRLAFHARRQEIEIMELVGAPVAYVRGPFVIEGLLQGGFGAAVAVGLLWVAYVFCQGQYGAMLAQVVGLAELRFIAPELCGSLVAGGMVIGCIGGFAAALFARRDRSRVEIGGAAA